MLHCKQYEAAMSSSKQTIPLICVTLLVLTHTASAQNSPVDYVKGHNAARSAVGVGPVAWNDTVAAYAKNYANQRAGDCSLTLSNGPYGENLFEGSAGKNWTAQDAIGLWVAGKDYYDHGNNTCASGKENECLVYEQVVWAKSTGIGCARVVCQNGAGVFINCNYYPAGNVIGERPY